jgi:hypothetical protein
MFSIYDICKFNEGKPSTFEKVPDHFFAGIRRPTNAEDGYPSVDIVVEDYVRISSLPQEMRESIRSHLKSHGTW